MATRTQFAMDLPEIGRTDRSSGTEILLPFLAAADELRGLLPDVDERLIEQSLFDGWPLATDKFIYVPEHVFVCLLLTASKHWRANDVSL